MSHESFFAPTYTLRLPFSSSPQEDPCCCLKCSSITLRWTSQNRPFEHREGVNNDVSCRSSILPRILCDRESLPAQQHAPAGQAESAERENIQRAENSVVCRLESLKMMVCGVMRCCRRRRRRRRVSEIIDKVKMRLVSSTPLVCWLKIDGEAERWQLVYTWTMSPVFFSRHPLEQIQNTLLLQSVQAVQTTP